jgi:hypothetical protein
MNRTRILALALAAVMTALVLAAPALSGGPRVPAPVDFEVSPPQPAPTAASARSGSARRVLQGAPVRTSRRFNVVGLRWRGGGEPAISVRVRTAGGGWSRWVPAAAHAEHGPDPGTGETGARGVSDPVWAGEADAVQLRTSRRLPGLRLHFVNSTGSATAASRARGAVLGALDGGVRALASLTAPARAQSSQPAIVPRAAWGAGYCPPRSGPSYGAVKAAFVHHTVTANGYSAEQAPAAVLGICRYHRNSNGWSDIGYNFLVDKYGRTYEGRAGGVDRPVVGAQAAGFNGVSTGISNIGTHSSLPQSDAALTAMSRLIRWKLPLHGQPLSGSVWLTSAGGSSSRYARGSGAVFNRVSGHRDGNLTSCPGDALYAQLPALRARVADGSAPPPVSAPAPKPAPTYRFGARVLRRGARGPDVRTLQVALNRLRARTSTDAIFGPRTERAVRIYERRRRLRVDGVVSKGQARTMRRLARL